MSMVEHHEFNVVTFPTRTDTTSNVAAHPIVPENVHAARSSGSDDIKHYLNRNSAEDMQGSSKAMIMYCCWGTRRAMLESWLLDKPNTTTPALHHGKYRGC